MGRVAVRGPAHYFYVLEEYPAPDVSWKQNTVLEFGVGPFTINR